MYALLFACVGLGVVGVALCNNQERKSKIERRGVTEFCGLNVRLPCSRVHQPQSRQ